MKDYYQILEIHPQASPEVMHKAYRALVQKYHPDVYHVSKKDKMSQRMQEINEAYDVLSDPKRRAQYDAQYQPSYTPTVPRRSLATEGQKFFRWFFLTVLVLLVFRFMLKMLAGQPFVAMGVLILLFVVGSRLLLRRKS